MRRLRGEQFCSVDHLDAYSAQQAEFALERLAASVTDKPNTARPPSPKSTPKLRPIAAQSDTAPEAPVTAGSVAVQEREVEVAAPVRAEPEPDYPLAPYLDQSGIPPREFETTENRRTGFAPVDNWGKAPQGWSMPPFHSEPSDPRTWNAGKLVAQIPPVAGWRELLAPKAPVDEETSAEVHPDGTLIRENAAQALLQAAPAPVWTGSIRNDFALPGNHLEPAQPLPIPGLAPKALLDDDAVGTPSSGIVLLEREAAETLGQPPATALSNLRSFALAEGQLAQAELAPTAPLASKTLLGEAFSVGTPGIQLLQPEITETLGPAPQTPAWTGFGDAVRHTFEFAEKRLAHADHVPTRIRTQASSLEWYQMSGAQFPATTIAQAGVLFYSGNPSLHLGLPQHVTLRAQTGTAAGTLVSETALDPAAQALALPHPLGWSWTQSITAPKVPMPDFSPARPREAVPGGTETWQEVQGSVREPEPRWLGTNKVPMPDFPPSRLDYPAPTGTETWQEMRSTVREPEPRWLGTNRVPMPDFPPTRLDHAAPTGTEAWQEIQGTVREPEARWLGTNNVAMPDVPPARLDDAAPAGTETWRAAQGPIEGPQARWVTAAHLSYGGPNFGWEYATAQQITLSSITALEAAPLPNAPSLLDFHARVRAGVVIAAPRILRDWAVLRTDTMQFESGPLSPVLTVGHLRWHPLMPFRVAPVTAACITPPTVSLRPIKRLVKPAENSPAVTDERAPIAQSGPVKYSPVAIVVIPPPQFALLPAALTDEQRYVAQVPNGVWRLPRVRHTGYRALGPFPKLPLRLPDEYLRPSTPEMAAPVDELKISGVPAQQDLSGMPQLNTPNAARIHPADYLVWPRPKGLKLGRMLPERIIPVDASVPAIKRFGPGRAGFLQDLGGNADGLAKA